MNIDLITYLSNFVMVFSILYVMRVGVKFISSLLSTPPKPLVLESRELLFLSLSTSYIITFIIHLL
jgi:hypothetical protein